ncbi:hypothetical protein HGRIS_002701 [Hohenbuehelia grisea]|uniref:DUF6534 domain-containing protein n=1 Tax=Hohenbuehelia grisea TaxID=104357 RepID=A0ABR3JLA8_9AGAR
MYVPPTRHVFTGSSSAVFNARLSGFVAVQTFVYIKCYSNDTARIKILVFSVWFLDLCHLICLCSAEWFYLITNFGDIHQIDFIPWSLALTIAFTAALTFLVHCFFVLRLFKLSERNWFVTVPMAVLAVSRLGFACLTTAKMIKLKSLSAFVVDYRWSFTTGLALSTTLDILITGCLCYFLLRNRKHASSMHHIIDALVLYTFENGSLTCIATVMSMICWIMMPSNLIFMGIHFFISKLYANSLLATLNARNQLQKGSGRSQSISAERGVPIIFSEGFRSGRSRSQSTRVPSIATCNGKRGQDLRMGSPQLHITVEKTIETVGSCVEDGRVTPSAV